MKLFTVTPMRVEDKQQAKILEALINRPTFQRKVYDKVIEILNQEARELIYGKELKLGD